MVDKERKNVTKTIVIFGAAKTGKSCIIKQFLNQTFDREYHATIEDVYNRKFEVNGIPMEIQFIDTGGFYNFPAMRTLCIKKAAGYILVFSVDEQESLYYLSEVLDQINTIHPIVDQEQEEIYTKHVPITLVGNKCDLVSKRCVYEEEVLHWLQESQLQPDQFVLTSAKEEDGIWDIFSSLYHQFKNRYPDFDARETKKSMASNIRRLSAFAALTVSPTQQLKTFFGSQISPELITCSSDASSSFSSSSGASPNLLIGSSTPMQPIHSAKIKRNSRPSLSKAIKENSKSGRVKEPIKVDCVLS